MKSSTVRCVSLTNERIAAEERSLRCLLNDDVFMLLSSFFNFDILTHRLDHAFDCKCLRHDRILESQIKGTSLSCRSNTDNDRLMLAKGCLSQRHKRLNR